MISMVVSLSWTENITGSSPSQGYPIEDSLSGRARCLCRRCACLQIAILHVEHVIAVEDPMTDGQHTIERAGQQEEHDDPKKRVNDCPVVLIEKCVDGSHFRSSSGDMGLP